MKYEIDITSGCDWGCDHTPEEATAFQDEVLQRVSECYPEAQVTVSEAYGPTKVRVYPGTSKGAPVFPLGDVEGGVQDILNAVWDDGNFWGPS